MGRASRAKSRQDSKAFPPSGEPCPCHKRSAEWPEWAISSHIAYSRRSEDVAGRATKRLHGGIYSELGLKGQQGTLVRGRRHESGEALMPDEHVRDVVGDSPDTGKKYESS